MSKQGDLFGDDRYPKGPGWRDPVTSRMAAEEIKETAASVRGKVLQQIGKRASTVHEMAERLHRPVPTVQPRFSELFAQGKIRWTGDMRRNRVSGKRAKVWELAR